MNSETTPEESILVTPTVPIKTEANKLRNERHNQVNAALLKKVLGELSAAKLTVDDLVSFVAEGHSENDTLDKINEHRARRHNLKTHQEVLVKAQETRKRGKSTPKEK